MESVDVDCSAGLVVEQSQDYPTLNDSPLALSCSSLESCASTELCTSNQNESSTPSYNSKVSDSPLEDGQESNQDNFTKLAINSILQEENQSSQIHPQSSDTKLVEEPNSYKESPKEFPQNFDEECASTTSETKEIGNADKSSDVESNSECLANACYSDKFRADLVNNNAPRPALNESIASDEKINNSKALSTIGQTDSSTITREDCLNTKKQLSLDDLTPLENSEINDKLLMDVGELSDRLNSPILRRTLLMPEIERKDCREVFSNSPSHDENSEKTETKNFSSLRDSLDFAKVKNLFSSPTTMEESPLCMTSGTLPVTLNFDKREDDETSDVFRQVNSQTPFFSPVTQRKSKIRVSSSRDRRVSFPKDDISLTTSYEPENPWCNMNNVTTEEIAKAYSKSCERHQTAPLPIVIRQIAALPLCVGGRIECLSLRNHKLDSNQCECLEEIFRRVQFLTLNFEGCSLDDDSVIPLFDMIEFYDSATNINISCNDKIAQRGWQACARMLKRTPSISVLNAHSTNLSEQNVQILGKALKLGAKLHTLHLENCNLTGRPLMILTGALKVNDSVTELYLADNRLGANDCIQIGNLIRSNKVIRLLDLRNNNIQDTGCSHICEGVIEQKRSQVNILGLESSKVSQIGLVGLVLWNNHLTIQSIPHVCLMLQSTHPLEILNLGRNNFTSDSILQLKHSLIRNHSLKQLGLQATRIGNEGAVALAEYIADNFTIERIDLRENAIQLAGLMALSQSLRINKTLIQIDLDNNMKAETSLELVVQHDDLYQEIKSYCQRNLSAFQCKEPNNKGELDVKSRKISLTCESSALKDRGVELIASTNEPKKYWSPAPSPSLSPCPSPSLSPSPSPVPSPLRSRFEVLRVPEKSLSVSPNNISIFSTSAPASMTLPSLSCSLPSLVQTTSRPNRFSTGGRFTVTRVKEEPASFKSSLPSSRTMSSPSLIVSDAKEELKPTIVVSSPNKPIAGFSVPDIQNKPREAKYDGSTSHVYKVDAISDSKSVTVSNNSERSPYEIASFPEKPYTELPFKAPLALMEAGSFDSDSEDSEVTTQSSDSTHSDEVKIGVEPLTPIQEAWGDEEKKDKSEEISKGNTI